jgi:hypothetical protein
MKSRIDVFVNHCFPFHFIAVGVVFIVVGFIILMMHPLASVLLFIIGIALTSTHYRLVVDPGQKIYKEYLWIMGFKKGEDVSFQKIEFIYLNKLNIKSGYGYVSRINVNDTIYKGFIKLSDAEPVFIGESKNEQKLIKKVERISRDINIELRKNY